MTYRPEIDGLRAVAVLLVLLFHARAPLFAGGFVGVDVFFVISGYLIASLIRHDCEVGAFSLVDFYERRIRRILPALVLVMATTIGLGVLFLLPDELAGLAASAVAASAMLANAYFARKGDYFEDESGTYPLLHLWSLSVEEQFYLAAPVALAFLLRGASRRALAAVAIAFTGSMALSIHQAGARPEVAFYSSFGRSFELLLGIGLALVARPSSARRRDALWMPLAGLAMISAATLLLDRSSHFPGAAALFPCGGTALIIAFATPGAGLGRLLAMKGAVYLGRISYPLYLWHWPLLVIAGRYGVRELTGLEVAAIYALALLLSVATHHGLERPLAARWPSIARRYRWTGAAAGMALVAAAGIAIKHGGGLPGRLPREARELAASGQARLWGPPGCHGHPRGDTALPVVCSIGAQAPVFGFALWGDSMANNVAPAIAEIARQQETKGIQLSHPGCPPLLDVSVEIRGRVQPCLAQNEVVPELLARLKVPRVVLVANWGWYSRSRGFRTPAWPVALHARGAGERAVSLEQALRETVARLQGQGVDVAIVGPIPEVGWSPPQVLASEAWHRTSLAREQSREEFLAWQARVLEALRGFERTGVRVVYPHERLCGGVCRAHDGAVVYYADPEHMTAAGLRLISPALAQLFDRSSQ